VAADQETLMCSTLRKLGAGNTRLHYNQKIILQLRSFIARPEKAIQAEHRFDAEIVPEGL
jgi:hypothetical protein